MNKSSYLIAYLLGLFCLLPCTGVSLILTAQIIYITALLSVCILLTFDHISCNNFMLTN